MDVLGIRLRAALGDRSTRDTPRGEGLDPRGAAARPRPRPRLRLHRRARRGDVAPGRDRRQGRFRPAGGRRRRRPPRPGRRHGDVLGPGPRAGPARLRPRPGADERRALGGGDEPHRSHRRPGGADRRRGAADPQWYAERLASGALVPEPDPVAVVVAAIEVYEADLALVSARSVPVPIEGAWSTPSASGSPSTSVTAAVGTATRVDRTAPTGTACTTVCASTCRRLPEPLRAAHPRRRPHSVGRRRDGGRGDPPRDRRCRPHRDPRGRRRGPRALPGPGLLPPRGRG